MVSTHSHPKVAAGQKRMFLKHFEVSTHSHPKVAAYSHCEIAIERMVSTHSHPKVAAYIIKCTWHNDFAFQHTATRRWLLSHHFCEKDNNIVSTHSHPKVAALGFLSGCAITIVSTHSHPKVAALDFDAAQAQNTSFNTQPPEGGCSLHKKARKISKLNTVFR